MIRKEFNALKLLQIENCHVDECGKEFDALKLLKYRCERKIYLLF